VTGASGVIGTPTTVTAIRSRIRTWTLLWLLLFLLSLVLWVGFLTAGGIFYVLSDAVALLLALAFVPVIVGYNALLRPSAGDRSQAAMWTGLVGMAITVAGSLVLLTSDVLGGAVPGGVGLAMQIVGFGLQGAWFVLLGVLVSRVGLFSRRVVVVSYLAGVGFLLVLVGSPFGPEHPLVAVGGLISVVAFVLWAIWTRKELQQP